MDYTHKTHRALKAGRELREWTQAEMAEKMAEATGDDSWTESRITAIENGRRQVKDFELRAFAEVQGFDVAFYWYGPPLLRERVGGSQRSHHLVGVNGLSLSDNTKTDEEAVGIWLRPRRSMALYGAKDLEPKRVHSHHDSKLFDGEDVVIDLADDESLDRWFDVADERKRIAS